MLSGRPELTDVTNQLDGKVATKGSARKLKTRKLKVVPKSASDCPADMITLG
jgi:hypothetical protein